MNWTGMNVFGVRLYLFELIAEAGSAAGEGGMQVRADASQQLVSILCVCPKQFHWTKKLETPECKMSHQKFKKSLEREKIGFSCKNTIYLCFTYIW